jgi:hypothetical protein
MLKLGYTSRGDTMSEKVFKTDNLALCPFILMNGLKYLRVEHSLGKNDKLVAVFVFEDLLGVGRDLQMDFMRSNEKKYRDLWFFFRNELERSIKKLDRVNREDKNAQYVTGEED